MVGRHSLDDVAVASPHSKPASRTTPTLGASWLRIGGIFVAGSLAWGVVADGFRPDRYDLIGAAVCLVGVGVIMFAPR